jgi:hypothetical protein
VQQIRHCMFIRLWPPAVKGGTSLCYR